MSLDAIADLAARLARGDRGALARAITLVESTRDEDEERADALLAAIAPRAEPAHRVAVSGPPGAGKSTLIEAMGARMLDAGRRVAVLAIDPSSVLSGGSILADKTRMPRLSSDENAFVRPSPSSATLGGVARRTRGAILLAEAAGFDTILVETVGVGQSEIEARFMVDTFLLVVLAGSGDEIQGIKRGIVEMAHVVVVNKADGDNLARAKIQAREFEGALASAPRREIGVDREVGLVSALTGDGLDALIGKLDAHLRALVAASALGPARAAQAKRAIWSRAEERLTVEMSRDSALRTRFDELARDVERGASTELAAARELVQLFRGVARLPGT